MCDVRACPERSRRGGIPRSCTPGDFAPVPQSATKHVILSAAVPEAKRRARRCPRACPERSRRDPYLRVRRRAEAPSSTSLQVIKDSYQGAPGKWRWSSFKGRLGTGTPQPCTTGRSPLSPADAQMSVTCGPGVGGEKGRRSDCRERPVCPRAACREQG